MNQAHPLLKTDALTIGYSGRNQPQRIVAESLTLDLWPGQLVCLLGPNGAGKSTLMRTMAGLQPPLSGKISIGGQPLTALNPVALARKLSLVLAERVDSGNILVRELVALGRTPYTGWLGKLSTQDNDKVESALRATESLAYAHRRLQQLSDGERQKVMLSRALAQDTDLILLDEPTAHLDLPNRVGMMRLLHGLTRQTNKAILLSTHELDLALQAADRLWLLDTRGNLVMGTPEDLVLNGAFEATFDKDGFYFDRTTGTFNMHTEAMTGPGIALTGDSGLLFWARRALLREGFAHTSIAEAICVIEAINEKGMTRWRYELDGQLRAFNSIDSLLTSLQPLKQHPPQINFNP